MTDQAPHFPCEVHAAASILFDVVVLAGGAAVDLAPLCQSTPKPLLSLCNRPLIWYCLKPWAERGCREFHLCVHKPFDGIQHFLQNCPQLEGVVFHYIEVPEQLANGEPSDTCDALIAYTKFKDQGHQPRRDVLVVSSDTVLANVDLAPFIAGFYHSFASTSVLLTRAAPPKPKPVVTAKGAKKGGTQPAPDLPDFQEELCFGILEETSIVAAHESGSGGAGRHRKTGVSTGSTATSSPAPSDAPQVTAHTCPNSYRLHFLCEREEAPQYLMPGFLARRPNVEARSDLIDVHVYLMRHWVLDVIRASATARKESPIGPAGEGGKEVPSTWRSIAYHAIPLLAGAQYPLLNESEGVSVDVAGRLNYEKSIPKHWALEHSTTRSIAALNSMQSVLPPQWDVSRVFATVYDPSPVYAILRVNNVEKYQAAAQHLLRGLSESASSPIARMVGPSLRADMVNLLRASGGAPPNPRYVRNSAMQSMPADNIRVVDSIIGRNVKIGAGSRITNSTIMDNVTIGDRCVVDSSVICPLAVLQDGVDVVECFVAANNSIEPGSYRSQTFNGPQFEETVEE